MYCRRTGRSSRCCFCLHQDTPSRDSTLLKHYAAMEALLTVCCPLTMDFGQGSSMFSFRLLVGVQPKNPGCIRLYYSHVFLFLCLVGYSEAGCGYLAV